MPLIRTQVRNEYGLGIEDLYLEPARRGDSKGVLDGVAVSGLVGILRQLGDLAGFAADIFHDLHEQVAATSARSHRMMARVQSLETSFPPIEKNIHTLSSHIHLAYLPGSDWHSDVQIEHGHLLASELPRFLMGSYEECRDPPRLFLLDKFDGGAGSCLRRYSDPTYFRRTWADTHMLEEERFVKERKHKKMKGLRMRNVEILHVTSLPRRNDRIQFSSSSSDEDNPTANAVLSSSTRQRREVESDTTSSDSRVSLVDVNPVPSASSSAELDGSFYKEMSESNVKIQQHYECVSVRSDEGLQGIDECVGSSRETKGLNSPFVKWDEKTELLLTSTPRQLDADHGEKGQKNWKFESECIHLEIENSKPQTLDQEDTSDNITSVPHQMKFQFGTGNTVSCPSNNEFLDEVNSEAENYVDALNSLESEAETNSEVQTKWEVKPVLTSGCPRDPIANDESENLAVASSISGDGTDTISKSYLYNQASAECDNSFTSKDASYRSSLLAAEHGYDEHMAPERKNGEILVSMTSSSHAGLVTDPIANIYDAQNTSGTCEHHEVDDPSSRSTASINNVGGTYLGQETQKFPKPPVEIWTNGGLLGLEPSKPPDFCKKGTVYQSPSATHINESDVPGLATRLNQKDNVIKYDKAFGCKESVWGKCSIKELDELHSSSDTSQLHAQASVDIVNHRMQSFVDDRENRCEIFQVSVSQKPAKCKLESSAESQSCKLLYETDQQNMTNCDKQLDGSTVKQPECSFQDMNANQGHKESDSRESVSSEEFSSTLFHLYPLPPPSPPLEHMKISFHPLNGNMTSKLKLEFADNHVDDSVEELTFPSFQLLPGADVSTQHISSESDDDTFCRSSHCSEVFSHHSETDSEIWEQDEHSISGKNASHDVENAVSSAASTPSSVEYDTVKHNQGNGELDSYIINQKEDGLTSLQSSQPLDIPGLESLDLSKSRQDKSCNTGPNEVPDLTFSNPNELPPLPPLPPLEWRQMKPTPVSGEFKSRLSEVLSPIKGKDGPNLTEPASVNGMSYGKEPVQPTNGGQVGGRNQAKKIISPKTPYEREDFLQQIRNKSFNLRRTVVNKPSFTPEPVANIRVAAILEKANTIRQAFVGSDGCGDEDNWSDG